MFKIGNHTLGPDFPPFIIAELSANHNGSLVKAKEAVKRAKNAGAHAVKIQTYTPETMTLDSRKEDFLIQDGLWAGYSLYELYDEAHTPYAWHEDLFVFASQLNMTLFSSVFDETSVDLLEKLGTPAYKIASFELTDIPLIDYVAKTKKPVLLSTGMSSLEEIGEAVETVKSNSILLFHCVSSYPTSVVESNIRNIEFLQKEFGLPVGLSDHTICQTAAIAATALGAVAIEKHFKVRKNDTGPDSSFSISPSELRSLVKKTNDISRALMSKKFVRSSSEESNIRFRRSLYFVKDKKCGDTVKLSDVRRIRPGFGLNPKHLDDIIDRKLTKDVERGDPVTWDVIE
jgi:pseudaminic acid synthase